MTLADLKQRLIEEGYGPLGNGPHIYECGPEQIAVQDFRVEMTEGGWRVCDTERGEVIHTYLETSDESEACDYWYANVRAMKFSLATFKRRTLAEKLVGDLSAIDVSASLAPLQMSEGVEGIQHQVLVSGRDLAKANVVLTRYLWRAEPHWQWPPASKIRWRVSNLLRLVRP